MRWYRVEYPIRFDQVARKVYGDVGMTQTLIRANPEHAGKAILSVGTLLVLPPKPETEPNGVNLWS